MITVKVQDDGGTANNGVDTITRTFTVAVTAVNDPPTLTAINDPAAILEDAAQQTINLNGTSAGPLETGQVISITTTSSNPSLIPDPTVAYNSPNAAGSLSYAPIANQSGTAVITVKVRDNGGTANNGVDTVTRTFTVAVTAVNDAPTLAAISDPAAILEDAGQQTVSLAGITAGPLEAQVLTVTATSDNPGLIPNPPVAYTSPNAAGSLSYTPVANQSGTAVITVKVQDNGGTANNGVDTVTRTFTVAVTAVNDPPTLETIPDPQAIQQDSGQQTINLAGITAGPFESQTLSITASSDSPQLIPDPAVDYISPNATGSLAYTPVAGQNGSAVITVTVRDAGLDGDLNSADDATFLRTFTVQVLAPDAVNHAPSFEKGGDQTATDEDGTITVTPWATAISAGPPNESTQSLTFIVTPDDPTLFASQPSIDPAGNLTFKPAPNARGTAHVTVQLKDNGGTANNGVDISSPQTFNIVITKPHPWHNAANRLDVSSSEGLPDGHVVAGDALAIINYINAFTAGAVPANAAIGQPFGFLDTDGGVNGSGDNFVAPNDALAVINFINSGLGGEGEAAATIEPMPADNVFQQLGQSTPPQTPRNDVMAMLLTGGDDMALQRRRRI